MAIGFRSGKIAARTTQRMRGGSCHGACNPEPVDEILEQLPAVLGEDRLGVKLHAFDRQLPMTDRHDFTVFRRGRDVEHLGEARALDGERVVARGVERRRHPGEHTALVMHDRRQLAMHHPLGADDARAERLPDRLVAEAYAEDRHLARETAHERHRDPGVARRAGPGRDDDPLRVHRFDFVERGGIVAHDLDRGPELAQVLDEVPGEAVVVVEHQQHGGEPRLAARCAARRCMCAHSSSTKKKTPRTRRSRGFEVTVLALLRLLMWGDAIGPRNHGERRNIPTSSDITNSARKMKKSTLAISAAPTAMPVNPNTAAINAITKNTAAYCSMANLPN